ncbi:ArsR/SmtB family transcription factor [Pseudofrankia inefficax]|uniref:Regulatory protein ArsR n=1 Tax=Pseudofrankia inefficax (strain DSM 45817 / CECT 9037 / DDB 130130 / EuI1c) TaxID=298654 RepID=E3IU11_PSEI1|nr:metalloregulator ArsR/SmtB family transcription factor [Pseudofrankia inefficax]ADP81204.1 regulatory protein ArsR [Pseudofrankia inefficax]
MAGSRPDQGALETVVAFAREISDPTRCAVLDLLVGEGPQSMSEIADAMGMPAPRVANHLARLRAAQLVTVRKQGRHAIYQVAGPHIGEALASLRALAAPSGGRERRRVPASLSPLARARSCYGHLAGHLGVALMDTLVAGDALRPPAGIREDVALGPAATAMFGRLDVDLERLQPGRRRFAFACLDWTERRPHLGGVLGGAVLESLIGHGLVSHESGTRALRVTARGQRELSDFLGRPVRAEGVLGGEARSADADGDGDPNGDGGAARAGGGETAGAGGRRS